MGGLEGALLADLDHDEPTKRWMPLQKEDTKEYLDQVIREVKKDRQAEK
jgi:hypothetical protein